MFLSDFGKQVIRPGGIILTASSQGFGRIVSCRIL